mmetsp:Transcript_41719/g.90509  ORF Transcript_41719/g.90509 Transcript_41719/m.90509 type:complete len:92 (+) Transcript_41719:628-903(+)
MACHTMTQLTLTCLPHSMKPLPSSPDHPPPHRRRWVEHTRYLTLPTRLRLLAWGSGLGVCAVRCIGIVSVARRCRQLGGGSKPPSRRGRAR